MPGQLTTSEIKPRTVDATPSPCGCPPSRPLGKVKFKSHSLEHFQNNQRSSENRELNTIVFKFKNCFQNHENPHAILDFGSMYIKECKPENLWKAIYKIRVQKGKQTMTSTL